MPFKAIPRQKPYCAFSDFIIFIRMLLSNSLISGKYIKVFESQFAKIFGQKYSLTVNSCRSAFSLIVDALGINEGDEVIIPAFNLPAFPCILRYKGIQPVFVDIDLATLNIDVNQIEQNISPKTKAIVVVHLFGNTCDMEKIVPIARKYNLVIIEDCANAFMTKYKDQFVGTYGDIACFSMGHSKDVPTFGGGIILTNDEALFTKMNRIHEDTLTFPKISELIQTVIKSAVFKIATSEIIFLLFVYPFIRLFALKEKDFIGRFIEEKDKMITSIHTKRFTNFQSFIGIKRLAENNIMQRRRIEHAQKFNDTIKGITGMSAPNIIEGGGHAYWNYTLLTNNRTKVLRQLIRHGIDAKKIGSYDCNGFEIFKAFKKNCPVSREVSNGIMALPVYHYLKEAHVNYICEKLA